MKSRIKSKNVDLFPPGDFNIFSWIKSLPVPLWVQQVSRPMKLISKMKTCQHVGRWYFLRAVTHLVVLTVRRQGLDLGDVRERVVPSRDFTTYRFLCLDWDVMKKKTERESTMKQNLCFHMTLDRSCNVCKHQQLSKLETWKQKCKRGLSTQGTFWSTMTYVTHNRKIHA